ncbi:MAG TPA: preprotein translocase subunit SecY, partial [Actinobacteria bacterium]|nr:preprotein translocase subunit SecY [Actinomycetota bacterium]
VVIPRLETLKKDGQSGQAKITQYTRYVTIGLAILQSTAIISLARTPGALFSGCNEAVIPNDSVWVILVMITVMTAGTAVVMWFGELITERGVGNGMSVLIFTSIIATIPAQFASIFGSRGVFTFAMTLLVGLAVVAFVVFVEQAQRRIPVQYAKR